jgi:hypothetical protein
MSSLDVTKCDETWTDSRGQTSETGGAAGGRTGVTTNGVADKEKNKGGKLEKKKKPEARNID